MPSRILNKSEIIAFLEQNKIAYDQYDHPAVFTVEQSLQYCLNIPEPGTKNLFLRDKNAKQFFLVVVPDSLRVNLTNLAEALGTSKLSFASPEKLMNYLGTLPGMLGLLSLVNDPDHLVKLIIAKNLWENYDQIQSHPLDNTCTLVLPKASCEAFLKITGHTYQLLDLE